jgi:repressor LexA
MTTADSTEAKTPLTERQQEVYEFIRQNIGFYGPTVREIAAALGIKSNNGVVCHLAALEKKGYIKRQERVSRGIKLTHENA